MSLITGICALAMLVVPAFGVVAIGASVSMQQRRLNLMEKSASEMARENATKETIDKAYSR
jgi:hypothetical protein